MYCTFIILLIKVNLGGEIYHEKNTLFNETWTDFVQSTT